MSKTILSPHWIPAHVGPEDRAAFARWQPPYIKIVTVDETVPYIEDVPPGATLVIRHHPLSENYEQRGLRDAVQARAMAQAHVDVIRRIDATLPAGLPRVYETLNEPHLWSDEPPELYAVYAQEALIYAHQHGMHLVIGLFGVGWPGNGGVQDAPVQWEFMAPAIAAMQVGDYLGLHEYWALNGPKENWRWWAGRFLQCPYQVPILITECGIDTGVAGTWYGGWHDLPGSYEEKAQRYVSELAWYEAQCRADGRVKGVFPFTFDESDAHWQKFNIRNQSFLDAFFAWMEAQPDMTPTPAPPPVTVPVPAPNLRTRIVDLAWRSQNVPRNPASAFFEAARRYALGAPLWHEERVEGYVWQSYANGVLYCREGDWNNVRLLDWYDTGQLILAHPVADAKLRRVTQRWGQNPDYYARFGLKGHNGLDFGVPVGSEIVAVDGGTVLEVASDSAGYGLYVKLAHTWGESLYAHLSKQTIAVGDTAATGQPVGLSGNTGNSTGAHLHFSIRINPYNRKDGWNGFSDPTPYLA